MLVWFYKLLFCKTLYWHDFWRGWALEWLLALGIGRGKLGGFWCPSCRAHSSRNRLVSRGFLVHWILNAAVGVANSFRNYVISRFVYHRGCGRFSGFKSQCAMFLESRYSSAFSIWYMISVIVLSSGIIIFSVWIRNGMKSRYFMLIFNEIFFHTRCIVWTLILPQATASTNSMHHFPARKRPVVAR